ncbi:hypothetical protein BGM26_02010 [Bacillus sp. FJAT-29790]|uniref:hypothetical protein n=1 Tax=Bacillus sp. FJAT-29790 TaxID=1895002 RepID=UPI001C241A1F|nr:hypothetical protein [Bacillus sp. FJAT-29790]MBU8877764.1 hypothetical protein [Bacillus sp. FJAT-29790]
MIISFEWILKETDTESLFAIKNNVVRESTKELIGDWLIETYSFKRVIAELFDQNKTVYQTEKEATDCLGTKEFLKNLLLLKTEDIQNASVEQYS